MLPILGYARISSVPPNRPHLVLQWRHASGLAKDILKPTTPVAEQLAQTGLWHYGRWAMKGAKRPKGEKARVNIVDEKLCDDVISYIKPSLQRHTGCDLIDIYPGAGVWSSKLHEALQPRSHILMEPDENIYKPFLKRLLAKSNTTLVPKSGIVWRDLSDILNPTYLPHQVERGRDAFEPPQRNDTLLVIANLAFHPKKRFHIFESVTLLVLFQLISSIRASSLFQKYGLVRMLVWVADDDKNALLPRSVQRRRRMAIDGELATDWIREVAGPEVNPSGWYVRDCGTDLESGRRVHERMRAAGLEIPKGRESQLVRDVLEAEAEKEREARKFFIPRAYHQELKELEAAFAAGKFEPKTNNHKRLLALRYRVTREAKKGDTMAETLAERDALVRAHELRLDSEEVLQEREARWNATVHAMNKNMRAEFVLARDNLHVIQQDPPVMSWDRRAFEPLIINPQNTEFFPNAPCALLDIQPKAMHPLMRSMGPHSDRAGDVFELVLRGMMQSGADPVSKALESVWPGAADGVIPHCPSLRDWSKGGMPVGRYAELSARTLNEVQLAEILEAWMKWPFRPTYPQLVGRVADDAAADMIDEDSGGMLEEP